MNKRLRVVFAVVLVFVFLIFIFIVEKSPRKAPEVVFFRVLDDNKNPIVNADCKADIFSGLGDVDDKPLKEIENIYDYVVGIHVSGEDGEKGFYELETGLVDYSGEFEIRIVCISQGNRDVGYAILNNTYSPCDVRASGRILIC